jgi:hypothetical protein
MATAQEVATHRQMLRQLDAEGYDTLITRWPQKMTWFKTVRHEDGTTEEVAMHNLPADAWHMERFLRRGFRPDLPRKVASPISVVAAPEVDTGTVAETSEVSIPVVASKAPVRRRRGHREKKGTNS